jgi:2-haloacid dehalogenase
MQSIRRRQFLNSAAAGIAGFPSIASLHFIIGPRFKAIAFDAFAVFDPRPVLTVAERLFPGKGEELSNAWRSRQFEYQWLHVLSQHYADFWSVTEDSLVFAADLLKLDLTPDKRKRLMQAYLELKAWPDVPAALKSLKDHGCRLALLSNATLNILDAGIRSSSLENTFEHVLSTDKIETYKPDPCAYQMAIDAFVVRKEDILFVAFAGWDAAGAKAFGYPTFWANRLNSPAERLGYSADRVGKDLNDLADLLSGPR